MDGRRFRPSLWATLFTIAAVALLLALGTWQMQRLEWKRGLIERLQERAGAEPAPLPASIDDPAAWEFRPVTVTGRFLHDRAMLATARPRQGRVGYEVVTPLVRVDGPPVLVNRGFVPLDARAAAASGPEGEVVVQGVVRIPAPPGTFQPDNRPGAEAWAWIDIPAMAAAGGLPGAAPVVVEQIPTGGLPEGIEPRVDLPNNHLQYAFTWYALAATLVVVFLLSQRRRKP